MELLVQEKEFDLEMEKFQNTLKNAEAIYLIEVMEASRTRDPEAFLESSFENFKEKLSEAIKKILEALEKFFKELRRVIDTKVQQFELNRKLKELKDIMAKKKAKALNQSYNYIDIRKYKLFYTEFINRYTAELKKGMNRDFKSVDEYEKWKTSMLNKLSDFDFKLSDEEQWKLSVAINSAVKLTEEEAANREKNLKMVQEDGTMAIKGLEAYYKKIDLEKSHVNYDSGKLRIFSLQNSFIGMVCSKLSQTIQKVAKFISKHLFLCVTGLLVVLLAL